MNMWYTSNSWVLLLAVLASSCTTASRDKEKTSRVEVLPYYDEATFTPHWLNPGEVPRDFHRIPSFSLINQDGNVVTEEALDGHVTVVDFFFTSCPGICPKMTSNMKLVQDAFMQNDLVVILSHSVTPAYDSVAILKEYAEGKGITKSDWHLLTGDRSIIYDLGRNQYFVEEDLGLEKDPDDFIHTENFILIDQKRRIRGIYNGLNKSDVMQLIADIKTLEKGA